MRYVTVRDEIKDVPRQWRERYAYGRKMDRWREPKWKEIYQNLMRLDLETANADDIAKVIGNNSWVDDYLKCDECGLLFITLARYEWEDAEYGPQHFDYCAKCLRAAANLIDGGVA